MAESLALRSPARAARWQVTFSSYYTAAAGRRRLPVARSCGGQPRGARRAACPRCADHRSVSAAGTREKGADRSSACDAARAESLPEVKSSPPRPAARGAAGLAEARPRLFCSAAATPIPSPRPPSARRRAAYPPLADSGIELGPPPLKPVKPLLGAAG